MDNMSFCCDTISKHYSGAPDLSENKPRAAKRAKIEVSEIDSTIIRAKRKKFGNTSAFSEQSLPIDFRRISCKSPSNRHFGTTPTSVLSPEFLNQCQEAVEAHLLKNYDGTPASKDKLGRPRHGAQHQSRAAMWALALLQMQRKEGNQDAVDFPNKWIQALVITCLLHDSGRKADGVDRPEWEEASAQHCREIIKTVLSDNELADICANAIRYKDNPENFPDHSNRNARLLRSLLHDADTLDVIRTRKDFQLEYLEVYKNFPDLKPQVTNLALDVRDIISAQHDLVRQIVISSPDQTSQSNRITEANEIPANYNDAFKKRFEYAENTLAHQLHHLSLCKPKLYQELGMPDYLPFAQPESKPKPERSLDHMVKLTSNLGMNRGNEVGIHRDLVTGKLWYVKSGSEAAIRNEKLMCDLARTLGLDVPECEFHEEAGNLYFLSQWRDGLSAGKDAFSSVSIDKKTQLMVIMSVLGNMDGVGAGYSNTGVDNNNQLVAIDWGEAGLFSSIAGVGKRKHRGVFASTPYELEAFKNPEMSMAKNFAENYLVDWNPKALVNATELFSDIKEQHLAQAAQCLLTQDLGKLSSLIEQYGPKKRVECRLLNTIIADRIAWLAIRYPDACGSQPLMPAEWHAVQASGVRGYARQVGTADVANGQIIVSRRQTEKGETETLATLRLTSSAADKLSDTFGTVISMHHLTGQLNFYRNTAISKPQSDEIRNELMMLKQKIIKLKADNSSNHGQWQFINKNNKAAITANEVEQQLTQVDTVLSQLIKQKNNSILLFNTLPELTFDTHRFPYRVPPVAIDPTMVEESQFDSGSGKLTGKKHHVVPQSPMNCYYHELLMDNGVNARFHANNLPEAMSLERSLTVKVTGDNLSAGTALFEALEKLGVDIHRPSRDELQSRYLDQLAVYYGCDLSMAREVANAMDTSTQPHEQLQQHNQQKLAFLQSQSHLRPDEKPLWNQHSRFLNGQLVFYRPPFPWAGDTSNESGYYAFHDFSYNQQGEQGITDTLLSLINSAGSLDSFNERSRKGVLPSGNALLQENIQQGAGSQVFTRLRSKSKTDKGLGIITGPETLGRLDTMWLKDNQLRHQSGPYPYDASYAQKHFHTLPSTPEVINQLANISDNIVNLAGSLSLYDELDHIQVTSELTKNRLIEALKPHFDTWPNGRPLNELITFSHSYQIKSTTGPCADLVKSLGLGQFDRFIRLNPDIAEGKLYNLRGFILNNYSFMGWNVSGDGFKGSYFINCKFIDGNFENLDLSLVGSIEGCSFKGCKFDLKKPENVKRLVRIIQLNTFETKEIMAIVDAYNRQNPSGLFKEPIYKFFNKTFEQSNITEYKEGLKNTSLTNCIFEKCDLKDIDIRELYSIEGCSFIECKFDLANEKIVKSLIKMLAKNKFTTNDAFAIIGAYNRQNTSDAPIYEFKNVEIKNTDFKDSLKYYFNNVSFDNCQFKYCDFQDVNLEKLGTVQKCSFNKCKFNLDNKETIDSLLKLIIKNNFPLRESYKYFKSGIINDWLSEHKDLIPKEITKKISDALSALCTKLNYAPLKSIIELNTFLLIDKSLNADNRLGLIFNMDSLFSIKFILILKNHALKDLLNKVSLSISDNKLLHPQEKQKIQSAFNINVISDAHNEGITAITALSADRFASASCDGKIKVWSTDKHGLKCHTTLSWHTRSIRHIISLPDGRLVSGGSGSGGTISIWKPDGKNGYQEGNPIRLPFCKREYDFVAGLSVLSDHRLAIAAGDGTINIWDLQTDTPQLVSRFDNGHRSVVTGVAALPNNSIATVSLDHILKIWDCNKPKETQCITTLKSKQYRIGTITLLPMF